MRCGVFEVLREHAELCLPEASVPLDPGVGVAERARTKTCPPHPPVALDMRQSGALENHQVLRHSRKRHVESRGELADRPVAGGEPGEDLPAGRVGQRAEGRVERTGMVNHMV